MSASTSKPNIIFIMADDHASKAISAYGAGINHTPNLDRLATDGMLLKHCYVTNSICTPSRAAIVTGQHNHVNQVFSLASELNTFQPNVAKHLRGWAGYTTGMFGKWHLGEGKDHEPTGFDQWDVVRGQGTYFDPEFISPKGSHVEHGYATDIITDKTLDFIRERDPSKPFFVMCHHKAPHKSWEYDPKHKDLYKEDIRIPETFNDDYKNRARAAAAATLTVEFDLTYEDLGLVQPDGGHEVGRLIGSGPGWEHGGVHRMVPAPDDVSGVVLIDKESGDKYTFKSRQEMKDFKYQRYMKKYLRTIQSIDDNVGRLLDYLDAEGLSENTIVIYTSDQGFFLGDHGWYDKRFIYEESFQMPFLCRGPGIKPGSICTDLVCNVDFAPTFLDLAGLATPSYMQGESFLPSLLGQASPQSEDAVAYHRYWMHREMFHNSYAHYGIRSARFKLIFWYNEGYGLPGTQIGGEEQEWELFDCEKDPLELFNVWSEAEYGEPREKMLRLLEKKMIDIGDIPAHPVGLSAEKVAEMYVTGANIAARAEQRNT